MKTGIEDFLKRRFGRLLLFGGLGAYVLISELGGHGPGQIRLPPLISSAHAADAFGAFSKSQATLKPTQEHEKRA